MFWNILVAISQPLVIFMVALLLVLSWRPAVVANHAKHGISIIWTRTILGVTLALVLALIVVLPRL